MTSETEYNCINCGQKMIHTRATPSADTLAGLEIVARQYRWCGESKWRAFPPIFEDIPRETRGLVLHSEAAAVIAAKDGYISEIANHLDCDPDCDSILHTIRENEADKDIYKERAEAAEAELAQIKAQEPVAWMYVNEDGECEQIEYDRNISEEDYLDPSLTLLYASPVSDSLKAENGRLREALERIERGVKTIFDHERQRVLEVPMEEDDMFWIARAALKGGQQ